MKKNKVNSYDQFVNRHIGPNKDDIIQMLDKIGLNSMEQLINRSVPESIRSKEKLNVGDGISEKELIEKLKKIAEKNVIMKSYIGMGYYNCITPPVIQRNILENPGWYTQYTPYQAEISQGRLEALINFQTMVSDLTGLPISNASLLDEATAAAEAMIMAFRVSKNGNIFLVSNKCHPQIIDVLKTRSEPLGIKIQLCDDIDFVFNKTVFGSILQYPDTNGLVNNFQKIVNDAHKESAYVIVATDLLSLALLKPPGELGADVAIGSSQRFGVPMGYGGPHAAFFAVSSEFKRFLPGRLIGVSIDSHNNQAYRMSLQTREQHIRREKATSNICTAQVLLAIMSGMYAVYHGPKGIKRIAETIHQHTCDLAISLSNAGFTILNNYFFDTIHFTGPAKILEKLLKHNINIRKFSDDSLGISMDETVTTKELKQLLDVFEIEHKKNNDSTIPLNLQRNTSFLTHPVFNSYHSETEMLRYIHRLVY
ncbi:MAG: glycine dehydrogenase (aminomethyl-transferring), partial [Candidatus Marinimicrobia bacterium]|nr:glycine dehydrogenase (aminomethyl-transferring) [Candidatus Neomarinimicrobiota bacterium]